MPSRIIKETIIISESLTAISAEAERFFWRLVVKADDFGLYYGDPRILASLCFPQKPPSEQKIRSWLNELVREDMVGTYTAPEDGKKRFPGNTVRLSSITNVPIVVVDYEKDLKTENGDDRYLVSVKEGDTYKKFFTASKEMKQILDKISDIEDGFPFETIIREERFGENKTKYIFT